MSILSHWSATKFMLWDKCPGEFKARYIDERVEPKTEAMLFGSAVHMGLEAHYRGEDGIRAYRAAWRQFTAELGDVDSGLTRIGMDLIEQVQELGLAGIPERGFSIDTNAMLDAPIVGSIDLWGDDGVIYDFKTTRGTWSQERAQKEIWQPILYTLARWEVEPEYSGEFEYIVLNRVTGQMQRFRREWTPEEIFAQMRDALERAAVIATDVRMDHYECRGKHGFCLECGERYTHDHVCDVRTMPRARVHAE